MASVTCVSSEEPNKYMVSAVLLLFKKSFSNDGFFTKLSIYLGGTLYIESVVFFQKKRSLVYLFMAKSHTKTMATIDGIRYKVINLFIGKSQGRDGCNYKVNSIHFFLVNQMLGDFNGIFIFNRNQ